MTTDHTITAIMPNYNDRSMIEGAVGGVLRQTWVPDEIIVIDDGSTDGSLEVIQGIASRNPNVRVLINESNRGVTYSFNRAIEAAGSKYLCFVSMDDFTHPTWIEKSMELLGKHPQAGICFTDFHSFYKHRFLRMSHHGRLSRKPRYFTPEELSNALHGNSIAGTSAVVRKAAFQKAGCYRPELMWHNDWFGWLVVAFRHGACYIPECLVTLRIRNTSHSHRGMKNLEGWYSVLQQIVRTVTSPEFRDVLPHFIRSEAFYPFGDRMLKAILRDPGLWTPETLMLMEILLHCRSRTSWRTITARRWRNCANYFLGRLDRNL